MATNGIPFDQLTEGLHGALLRPDDSGYDETRRVHNGLIDKRPAAIARCSGVSDVVAAVNFANDNGLEISVRGGGHSVSGKAVCEGGLMIDLAGMKGMFVNPRKRTARAQAGLTWAEFNRETQLHGLATTGGVISTTGIAGLTLGGGIGFLMAKHGLSADNLLSAEVVTADGEVLRAAQAENEDLFWALRGGGGNFGIVTSFQYRLHPVGPQVTGGLAAWSYDDARDVLQFYREFTAQIPDEIVALAGLVHAPDGSGMKICGIIPCHCGSPADGRKALAPVKEFGSPVMDMIGPIPYENMNMLLDAGYPKGNLNYWKSSFLSNLSDDAIDEMVARFGDCPSPGSGILLEHFHGAATRVAPTATAFANRSPGYNLLVLAQWTDPAQTGANIAWARETFTALEPYMSPWNYVNYLADEEDAQGRIAGAYGPNLERLRDVKRRYDPQNLLHLNQNIAPAEAKR